MEALDSTLALPGSQLGLRPPTPCSLSLRTAPVKREATVVTSQRHVGLQRASTWEERQARASPYSALADHYDHISPGVPNRVGQSLCLKPRVSHEVF